MKTKAMLVLLALAGGLLMGCASVDVTQTAKGMRSATNPNDVEILITRPERRYEELGTVTVSNYSPTETAKMHNAVRAKAAPLGATAVILNQQGMVPDGWGGSYLWATGVAIRYLDQQAAK